MNKVHIKPKLIKLNGTISFTGPEVVGGFPQGWSLFFHKKK